jgi:hypothetical protein
LKIAELSAAKTGLAENASFIGHSSYGREGLMVTEMVRRGRLVLLAFCALGILFLSGCGPKRVPAGGTVELDGKPMEGGILYFQPNAAKGNTAQVNCSSPIKGGRFQLQTAGIERSDSGSGVPPGWYKVTLRVNMPGEKPIFPGQPAIQVNPKYLNAETTDLEIEVVENPQPGAYDLKLTSK